MGDAPIPSRDAACRAVFLDAGGTLIHMDRAFVLDCLVAHGVAADEARLADAERYARDLMCARARSERPGTDEERFREAWTAALQGLGCGPDAVSGVIAAARERSRQGLLWTRVVDGTRAALEALRHDGLVLGVVSNSNGRVADFLEAAGLRDLLDFVVDSALVGVEKPDPGIFRIACGLAGVAPSQAVHVGDLYDVDVLGARAAGIEGVLVTNGDDIGGFDCPCIPAMAALPAWLAGRAAGNGRG